MQQRREGATSRWLLWTSCVLLAIIAGNDVIETVIRILKLAGGEWRQEATPGFQTFLWFASLILGMCCIGLEARCILRAVRVTRLEREDTHDHVAVSQLLAITLIGLNVVAWCLTMLSNNAPSPSLFLLLVLEVLPAALYYKAIGGESHSQFWEGIRVGVEDVTTSMPTTQPPARMVLDASTGMVREAAAGERPNILLESWGEFSARLGDVPLLRRAERLVKPIALTAAYPIGNTVFGTFLIPDEELKITGLPLPNQVAMAYYLTGDSLFLICEDDVTRTFLRWCLDNQYLRKETLASFLYEIQDLVIGDDAAVFINLDDRLDQLQASVSESVTEVPQDFSEYVSEMRKDLNMAAKFYRQMAEAARDIAVDESRLDDRERRLFEGLENRARSLFDDARDLRDYVQQIRDGYQERINVRQNNVMSILTIVTTISTPIALATGWYGMNFDNMPELHNQDAYGMLTAAVVAVVTLEVIYFKKKRWF